jgi:hypothetical protein
MNTDQTTFFSDHIRKHASEYYCGLGPGQPYVHLVNKQQRKTALLYQFKVDNLVQAHSVFVKVFRSVSENSRLRQSAYEKPLLYPKTDPHDRHRLYYTALKATYDYLTCLNQSCLGAIRVLDYLPEHCAVITDGSCDVKLRQLFWRKNYLYSPIPNDELSLVFQNAGIWLNLYHKMPKDDVIVRSACREDYIEAIIKLKDFLIVTLGDESFFNQCAEIILNKAHKTLPVSLPLGLAHGDFAQRNILIGPNAHVTVLDTFARWRTPVYQDIGYFLNDLKMAYPQAISRGFTFISNQLITYERAFLRGYFGQEPVPYSAVRLYEALALLDKWSATVARAYQQSNSTRIFRRSINGLKNRYFKRGLKSLLVELTEVKLMIVLFVTEFTEITTLMQMMA